jgi:hypothetical protein
MAGKPAHASKLWEAFLTIAFYFKIVKNINPVTFWLHAQGSIIIIRENLQVLV